MLCLDSLADVKKIMMLGCSSTQWFIENPLHRCRILSQNSIRHNIFIFLAVYRDEIQQAAQDDSLHHLYFKCGELRVNGDAHFCLNRLLFRLKNRLIEQV